MPAVRSAPAETLRQMLIDDLPLGGPDEPVRTWLKDRRQMRQLVPWVLKRRDIYGEFAVAQRRVVITRRLAEWLLDELGIDPNRVDAYAKDPGFQGICRYSIEKGADSARYSAACTQSKTRPKRKQSVRRVPRGDPSRAAEQGIPSHHGNLHSWIGVPVWRDREDTR